MEQSLKRTRKKVGLQAARTSLRVTARYEICRNRRPNDLVPDVHVGRRRRRRRGRRENRECRFRLVRIARLDSFPPLPLLLYLYYLYIIFYFISRNILHTLCTSTYSGNNIYLFQFSPLFVNSVITLDNNKVKNATLIKIN